MKSIVNNIEVFKDYFSGKIDISGVDAHLQSYNFMPEDFLHDFTEVAISSNDEVMNEVIALLLQLNVNMKLWQSYFSQDLSLYSLLKELAKDHEHSIQLNQLFDLLLRRKFQRLIQMLWRLGIPLLVVLLGLGIALYTEYQSVFHFLFDTANIIPILGIVFNVIALGVNVYVNHLYDRRPNYKIYRDDAFIMACNVLNTLGKIILITGKSGLTPLSVAFFILSSLVSTLKEFGYLIELYKKYQVDPGFEDNELAIIRQQYCRHRYDYIKQRNTLSINLAISITLTILVVTCAFLPVGIVLTLSTSASITLVYLIKLLALYLNEQRVAKELQAELKQISEQYEAIQIDEATLTNYKNAMQDCSDQSYEEAPADLATDLTDKVQESNDTRMTRSVDRTNFVFFKNGSRIGAPRVQFHEIQDLSNTI